MFALPEEGFAVVCCQPGTLACSFWASVFGWPGELEEGSDG